MSPIGVPLVLLVDDHANTREMYALMLSMSGFAVAEAENGAEALARADEQLPSVVVTDLRMPGEVSALDLCHRLRERGVPVIVLTGVGPGDQHDEVRAAGCAVVLMKPVTPSELVAELHRILSRTEEPL